MADSVVGYATLPIIPSFQGFGSNLAGQVGSGSGAAGAKVGGLFAAGFTKFLAAGAIVAGTVAVFKGLYTIGSIYDEISDTIRIDTGATGEALTGLMDSVKRVSTQVPASLTDIGSAVSDLNQRLGYTGPVLEGVTARVLELGRMQDAPININNLSAALTGFQVPGDKANDTLDELFRISQRTGVPVDTLTKNLATQGGVLSQLGFSLTSSASLLGTLDKAGVNSTTVMRSLSAGIVRLAKDGEAPEEAFSRVVGELEGFIEKGDQAGALNLAGKVFGTRGATQFIAALNSGAVSLDDLTAGAATTGDTILGVSKETRDWAENWQLIKNKGIDLVSPAATALFDTINAGLSKVTDSFLGLPPLGELFAPALAVIQPVIDAVGGGLADAFASIWAAISPLIPQLVTLWTNASPLMIVFQALTPILPQVAALFAMLGQTIGGALGTILPLIIPLIVQLATIIGQVLAAVLPIVMQLLSALAPIFAQVVAAVMPLVVAVLSLLSPILDLISPLLELIGPILTPLIDIILLVITSALKPLMTVFQAVLPPVLALVAGIVESLMPVIVAVTDILGGLITFLTGVFTGNWKKAWSGIQQVFKGIWDGIVGILKGAVNISIDLINGIIGGINQVAAGVKDATGGAINLTIPKIPRLAAGADIAARRGGTLAVLGEAGQAETVSNLGTTNRALAASTALAERALNAEANRGGDVNFYGDVGYDPEEIVEEIDRRKRQAAALEGTDTEGNVA